MTFWQTVNRGPTGPREGAEEGRENQAPTGARGRREPPQGSAWGPEQKQAGGEPAGNERPTSGHSRPPHGAPQAAADPPTDTRAEDPGGTRARARNESGTRACARGGPGADRNQAAGGARPRGPKGPRSGAKGARGPQGRATAPPPQSGEGDPKGEAKPSRGAPERHAPEQGARAKRGTPTGARGRREPPRAARRPGSRAHMCARPGAAWRRMSGAARSGAERGRMSEANSPCNSRDPPT